MRSAPLRLALGNLPKVGKLNLLKSHFEHDPVLRSFLASAGLKAKAPLAQSAKTAITSLIFMAS